METSSVELLKRLVGLGFGLSVVPAMAVEREVSARELAAVAISDLPAGRSLGLVAPMQGPSSRAAQQFATLCRELVVEQPSEKPKA
jgi:DNA-binding transcriptional LysR family regulator